MFDKIKNVIRWLPVIWKDRDWDYYHIYVILRTKLAHMEKLIRYKGHHVRHNQDADDIKLVIDVLERLIKDDYLENALKNHHEKWGKMNFKFHPIEGIDGSRLEFIYEKANTEKEKALCEAEFKRAGDHAERMLEQDLEMLFTQIRKKIRHWWD